jgi:hypothetical protein
VLETRCLGDRVVDEATPRERVRIWNDDGTIEARRSIGNSKPLMRGLSSTGFTHKLSWNEPLAELRSRRISSRAELRTLGASINTAIARL